MKSFRLICQLLIPAAVLFAFNSDYAIAQKLKPGPQDLSFFSTADERDQPYAVYIPENFDENKAYPLVVFLHGAWSNQRLGLRRLFGVGISQGYEVITPGNVPFETVGVATRYWRPFKPVDYI